MVRFDAFISYSHAADGDLAPALRRGLHQLAKPWYRTRAAKVFVDEASLSTNPALWSSITAALGSSRTFVLLCSPEAACSEWVDREVTYWLANKPIESLLPVLTAGELVWDPHGRQLDMERSTAAPPALRAAFGEEPRHLDLRWTKVGPASSGVALSLQNSRFKDAVADLAAPIRGVAKDDLVGEDIRQHLRTRRLARSAVAALCVLLIMAVVSAVLARANAVRAEHRRVDAEARRLGLEATGLAGPPDLAFALAAQGFKLRPTNVTSKALVQAADAAPQLIHLFRSHTTGVTAMLAQPAAHRVVSIDRGGMLLATDTRTGTVVAHSNTGGRPFQLVPVPSGILVVTRDWTEVHDIKTLAVVKNTRTPNGQPITAVAVVAKGIVVGDLGEKQTGDLWWYGATSELIARDAGAPVGVGADGDGLIVLFTDPGAQAASVRRFDRTGGKWKQSWRTDVGPTNTVMRVSARDGVAVIGATNGDITIVNLATGAASAPMSSGTSGVRSIAIADGTTVLVGDAGGTIHWLDPKTGAVTYDWSVHAGAVSSIVALNNDTYYSAGADGTIAMQRRTGFRKLAATTITLTAKPFSIDAHPETGIAHVGLADAVVDVDLHTNRVRSTTPVDTVVYAVAQLPGSDAIAVGDAEGRVLVVSRGEIVQTIATGAPTVLQLIAIRQTSEMVELTDAGTIGVRRVVNGRLGTLRRLADNGNIAAAVSSDGQWVAYQDGVKQVVVLRLRDGHRQAVIPTDTGMETLAFNTDASILALASDGGVSLVRLALSAREPVVRNAVAQEIALSAKPVAVGFDGEHLLVADSDTIVTTFDARTGEDLGAVQAFQTSRGADLRHGAGHVYVLAGDSLVVRDVTTAAILRSGCAVFDRALTTAERTRYDVGKTLSAC